MTKHKIFSKKKQWRLLKNEKNIFSTFEAESVFMLNVLYFVRYRQKIALHLWDILKIVQLKFKTKLTVFSTVWMFIIPNNFPWNWLRYPLLLSAFRMHAKISVAKIKMRECCKTTVSNNILYPTTAPNTVQFGNNIYIHYQAYFRRYGAYFEYKLHKWNIIEFNFFMHFSFYVTPEKCNYIHNSQYDF